MKIRIFVAVVFLMLSLNACANSVQVQVNVYDDDGQPVEGANVKGAFNDLSGNTQFLPSMKDTTDTDGKAEISGNSVFYVPIWVSKNEYYESHLEVDGRQPGKVAVNVLLRPKRNPIPMYAKTIKLKIPERGREFGFDFIIGDLVSPGYDGTESDVKISLTRIQGDDDTYVQTLMMRFENSVDGVAKIDIKEQWKSSALKMPYVATLDGYGNHLTVVKERTATQYKKENFRVPLHLRIRSKVNQSGKLESAQYCKIYPGIELMGVLLEQPRLKMTYYCNPTPNDLNLEFDPKRNLFENLKPKEQVSQP